MPNSKRRKRQIAANKRQIERAKRQLETLKDEDQENVSPPATKIAKGDDHKIFDGTQGQESTGWMGGLYSWCQSGLSQVSSHNNLDNRDLATYSTV